MNDNAKKQVPLRLSPKLYAAIAAWAEDDFRSVNGQIEYLLTEYDVDGFRFDLMALEDAETMNAVRAALDHATITQGDLRLRSCTLTDSEEAYQDDAYVQQLVFTVNI